jgi:hypothetical protein
MKKKNYGFRRNLKVRKNQTNQLVYKLYNLTDYV